MNNPSIHPFNQIPFANPASIRTVVPEQTGASNDNSLLDCWTTSLIASAIGEKEDISNDFYYYNWDVSGSLWISTLTIERRYTDISEIYRYRYIDL